MTLLSEKLFVDASAWVALADRGDSHHLVATNVYPGFLSHYRLITTNLVIAEAYIILRRNLGPDASFRFLSAVTTSPRVELIRSSEELEQAAEAFLRKYRDHELSLADAVSFALMKGRRVGKAFTFDHHFAIVGFDVLPPNG